MSNDYIEKCFSILPYIPIHVREYLCNCKDYKLQPISLECYGVVMMVDVSGYSKFASYLAQKGSIGPELLSNCMNGYLNKMIKIILSYKGDLVKFAGDAVIICWSIEDINKYQYVMQEEYEEMKLALLINAVRCSFQMLTDLSKYTVEIDNLKIGLSVHIALGVGPLFNVHVGGYPGRWEHFISGGAVNQVGKILDLAKAGQVALSIQAYKQLMKACSDTNLDAINNLKGAIIMEATIKNLKQFFISKRIFSKLPNIINLINSKNSNDNYPEIDLDKEKTYLNNLSQSSYTNQNEEVKSISLKIMENELKYSNIISAINEYIGIIQDKRVSEIEGSFSIISERNSEKLTENVYNMWREYVNEGALAKIESGTKNLIKFSELRRITSLFVKMGNIKFENSNDLTLAQESLDAVQRALVLQEGILRQFLIDDKGAIILIYFGLPPSSHENDAQVGIEAALEICKNLKRINDNFTIGVGTGITWVGGIGNEDRADYSVVGDSVNMAARLMMKAEKGTIYCDEETYKLTKESISYISKGTLVVKGKSKSIAAYQPVNSSRPIHLPKITNEIELIGREKEIEVIESLLVNYSTKCEGKTLLVQGIEGFGLMPLAELLIKEAKKNSINVCTAVAKKIEKTTVLSVYKPIIMEIISLCMRLQQKRPMNSYRVVSTIERSQNNLNKYYSTESLVYSMDDIQSNLQEILSPASTTNNRYSLSSRSKTEFNIIGTKSSYSFDNYDMEHGDTKENDLAFFKYQIMNTLSYLGEDPSLVGLFSIMFPNIISSNNGNDDDSENTITEFNNLLVKLITKLTYKIPLIIVIDQLQYLDSISWKLTELLYKSSAKMLFCLFTYPESYYTAKEKGLEALKNISKSKRTVNILLGSVSEEAACEIIKDLCTIKFNRKCTGVSESILKIIYEGTRGTPIYIRRMTTWMLELPNFKLNNDGSLTMEKNDDNPVAIETIVPSGGIESIVVAQFDKLDSDYQEFLKIASVVGQFKVIDIKNFIDTQYKKEFEFLKSEDEFDNRSNLTPEELFKNLDKYGFLKVIYQECDYWLDNIYAFSSDMIQKAIYELNTFSKREEIHLYFAHFYEREYKSNPERQDLLVNIYEHYSHSPDKQKTKEYLEKVCKYYYKLKSMEEAIKYYRILFKLFRYEQYSAEITQIGDYTLSEWHKQIGEAYLTLQKYKEAENHIIVSLRLMEVHIPAGGINLWWLLKRVNKQNNAIYLNDFETSQSDSFSKDKKSKMIRECLLLLSEIYNYLHKQNLFKISIKMALSYSKNLKPDIKYILILSMYSLELIANALDDKNNFQIGTVAMNKAKTLLENFDNNISYDCLLIHDSLAQCYFILGDWKNSLNNWISLISKSKKLNELALWDKGVIMKAFTEFHSGNTESCLKTSLEMLNKRKSWKNQCLAYASIFMNFILQNEEEDMIPVLTMIYNLRDLAEKMNSTNYSIQLVFYGLVGQVYYRFGVPLIDNVLSGLTKIVKYLDRIGHPSWGALISFPHILDLLYYSYYRDIYLTDSTERTVCLGILYTLIDLLEKHFASYLICIPILALARGLIYLISGKYELAIETWKTGLIDQDEERISNIRLPYFTGKLYSLIKMFSLDVEEKENATRMFNEIGNMFSYAFEELNDVPIEERHICMNLNNSVRNRVYEELLNKTGAEIQRSRSINYITQQQNILSLDMKSNLINENIHRGIPDRSKTNNLLKPIQAYQSVQPLQAIQRNKPNSNLNVSPRITPNANKRNTYNF